MAESWVQSNEGKSPRELSDQIWMRVYDIWRVKISSTLIETGNVFNVYESTWELMTVHKGWRSNTSESLNSDRLSCLFEPGCCLLVGSCKDKFSKCSEWLQQYTCDEATVKHHCPKSCNACWLNWSWIEVGQLESQIIYYWAHVCFQNLCWYVARCTGLQYIAFTLRKKDPIG